MPKILVLPHPDYAPLGAGFSVAPGTSICDAMLDNGVEIDHACGKVGACTTCHVIVRKGGQSLPPANESEEDMLYRAWGVEQQSRLACQAIVADVDLVVEIPKYSLNHAKEGI